MALASSGITTSLVGNTLGISNRNVGGLCTSSNVNPWSKWKPIHSTVSTMTLGELKNRNYGIQIIQANNPTSLVSAIKANGNTHTINLLVVLIVLIDWGTLEIMNIVQLCLYMPLIKMVLYKI